MLQAFLYICLNLYAMSQVAGVRDRRTRPAEVRGALEEHQRQLARWEGRVARQLEKIVALQRGGRTPGSASAATPGPTSPFSVPSGAFHWGIRDTFRFADLLHIS